MQNLVPKQLVLAKIKGFPDWPAVIVPVDQIPTKLQSKKFTKHLQNYLQSDSDQVCVKFYYDDQYSWTKVGNIKPLNEQIVNDYLISVGEIDNGEGEGNAETLSTRRGGRRKRITDAYLKVVNVPIDEFLQWGSWGKPKTPEPEPESEPELEFEDESKRSNSESDFEDGPQRKKAKTAATKKGGRPKREVVKKSTTSKNKSKTTKKPGRPKKKQEGSDVDVDIDDLDDDEEFLNAPIVVEEDEDEEYVTGSDVTPEEDEPEEEDEEEDEEEEPEEDEEEEEDDDDGSNKKSTKAKQAFSSSQFTEIVDELKLKQPADFKFDFSSIPSVSALVDEVAEMSAWCTDLRSELQSLIFPLKPQKKGMVESETEPEPELKTEEPKHKTEEDANGKSDVNEEALVTPVDQETVAASATPASATEPETPDVPVNYTKLNKAIDELITPLIDADLSKSILKTSGLSNIVYIILSKPELQTPTKKKLRNWWLENFHYDVGPDEHWSDDFTIAMHKQDESARKEREAEKRRRRKEERRLQQLAGASATASANTSALATASPPSTPAPEA